jgi:hypothetical protein
VTGSFVYTLGRPGYVISGPIRTLTDYSSDVFTGVVSGTRSHLSENSESIVTDYDVDVDEVIKGSTQAHGRVVVEIEGGRVTFPDGAWAEVRVTSDGRPDGTFDLFAPPRVGERFAFFCSSRPPTLRGRPVGLSRDVLFLNYGAFGLYELARDGLVNPRGSNRDIGARYRGQPADGFLREVRDSLPKITGKFGVTVDSPERAGMPIWVHADFGKELLAYPYSFDLRDIDDDGLYVSCNRLELKRNGEVLAEQSPQIVVRSGPVCGSAFYPDSPRNRLPLHLAFKIDRPGHYSVRWTMMRPDPSAWSGQQSDWVDFDVVAASPAERDAWLTKLLAAPPSTTGKFVAEYLPSLLAAPSDPPVAQTLVDALESRLDSVASYARGSLYLSSSDVLAPLLLKTLRERGPTEAIADAILWRSAWFQDVRDDIVRTAASSLASDDDRRVSGAVKILGGLSAFDWHGDSSVMREASQTIERSAPSLLARSHAVANQTVMLLGSVVRTDAARELLWQAVNRRHDVREQAAIAIAWIHDPRDLPTLADLLISPPNGDSSVADSLSTSLTYQLRTQYGESAVPYLQRTLTSSLSRFARIHAAQDLAVLGQREGFRFFLESMPSVDMWVRVWFTDHFKVSVSDEALTTFLKDMVADPQPAPVRSTAPSTAGLQLRSKVAAERVAGANALIDICMQSRSFGLECRDAVDDVTRRQIGSGPEDVSAESWRDAALISGRFQFGNSSNLLVRLERDGATDALIACDARVVPAVAEVLKVAGPTRRRLAASVLGAIGNADAAEALRAALLSESDSTVRPAIQHALDHLGERPGRAIIR